MTQRGPGGKCFFVEKTKEKKKSNRPQEQKGGEAIREVWGGIKIGEKRELLDDGWGKRKCRKEVKTPHRKEKLKTSAKLQIKQGRKTPFFVQAPSKGEKKEKKNGREWGRFQRKNGRAGLDSSQKKKYERGRGKRMRKEDEGVGGREGSKKKQKGNDRICAWGSWGNRWFRGHLTGGKEGGDAI